MHWDVVAGPGSHGADPEGPASLPEVPPEAPPLPEGSLDLDAALLLASFLAEGTESPEAWVQVRGPAVRQACVEVAARSEAWWPKAAAPAVEGCLSPTQDLPEAWTPGPAEAGPPALVSAPAPAPAPTAVPVVPWQQRAEAAEAAALAWGERLAQAEAKWAAERENLKHNHLMLQRAAGEQGFAQAHRARRQRSIALGLALAALALGMPAAWLGGSQAAAMAADPAPLPAEQIQAARAQGHQQVVDALGAQASAAVVAKDLPRARILWGTVADLARAAEDREAAQAALQALGPAPAGALAAPRPEGQVPVASTPAAALAPPTRLPLPALGAGALGGVGAAPPVPRTPRLTRVRPRLDRLEVPSVAPAKAPLPPTGDALHEGIPAGVRDKF